MNLKNKTKGRPWGKALRKKVKLVISKKIKSVFLKVNYNYKCGKLNSYLEE